MYSYNIFIAGWIIIKINCSTFKEFARGTTVDAFSYVFSLKLKYYLNNFYNNSFKLLQYYTKISALKRNKSMKLQKKILQKQNVLEWQVGYK